MFMRAIEGKDGITRMVPFIECLKEHGDNNNPMAVLCLRPCECKRIASEYNELYEIMLKYRELEKKQKGYFDDAAYQAALLIDYADPEDFYPNGK